ncbi:PAS domain-containing sensor histidine kinase [Telmatospirillum sp. J64-1]|uniref:hybrid sensor histidine kinase/response regulator n=1 Tax=Telmatospirillum sp. J64-1 TaxID=2502183 RepID=UPI00210724B7|nr:PAS domain-containing protein [Telmatospirillum sp. J64-1]
MPVVLAVVLGLAAGVLLLLRQRRQAAAETRAFALARTLDSDRMGRLLVGAEGQEIYRNAPARRFGLASDPLAPFAPLVEGDERAQHELARLRSAALVGESYRAELALTAPGGEREWLRFLVRPVEGLPGARLWAMEDVSARRAIDETLRREYESLTDFIDFLPVGCYSADTDGRIRYANQRLADWLGRSPLDLIGADLREVLGAVPNPEEDRSEMRLKGRGGEIFQAFLTHTVFDEGGETFTRSVVVRDLMPERQWERALRTAERRFRWLFDDAPVGIALVDLDGTLALCNPAFQDMLGLKGDDVAGRPVVDVLVEEDHAAAEEGLSRVLMGSSRTEQLEVRLKGPRGLICSLYVNPSVEEGEVSGLVLHFIDTTERKNLEIQFAQSQKMQAMGQLAGGVAHDFNNLLTAMIGFCDLLLQRHGAGDPSFADIMQIKQNANRAAALVRQLLAFSRRQALQPRLLDVTDALADLSNLLRRLLGETIELRMVHGRGLGLVRVDPGQFDQVIINLAVNARDAMPGGGMLTIRTGGVAVERPVQRGAECMPPGEYVLIEVSDTGTGIPKDLQERIFEPFFSTKEVGAGTGLGLSTVYGIVRQTDGYVFVDSAPGQGATFSIYLPRSEAEAGMSGVTGRAPRPNLAAEPPAAGDLTGAGTILLVEDEDAVRLFGSRALRNKGYRVLEASDGEAALDVLRAEDDIDVLISDVVMPGMDGMTLSRLVRMERPSIQIILISGYSEDVARGELAGLDGVAFLPKPFSLKQLAGAVKEAMAGCG